MEPLFYTINETAELLNCAPVTVRKWLKEERIPFIRFGPRAIRIRAEDMKRIINEGF
jgi:excisionase family DNA binding protein